MLYSKPCEYAIRALAYMAREPHSRAVTGREIARAEKLPAPILGKILQDLARRGLLRSRRGPGGGFVLARPARKITLRDIVEATDGLEQFRDCAVGLERCSDESPCPLHDSWKSVRRRFERYLERTTLEAMARAVVRKKQLLAAGK
jgi:Rrf2 family protein